RERYILHGFLDELAVLLVALFQNRLQPIRVRLNERELHRPAEESLVRVQGCRRTVTGPDLNEPAWVQMPQQAVEIDAIRVTVILLVKRIARPRHRRL